MTAKECVDRLHAMQSKAKEKDREPGLPGLRI